MQPLLKNRQPELRVLCRRFGVSRLEVFGSAATESVDPDSSDLDFIVDFADRSPGYADRYLAFGEALKELFDCEVDLVTERSLSNPYFQESVDETRRVLYDEASEEAGCVMH